ncbi:MAG TPA: putative sulfate exporter family transporter [Rhodopila sp.]|nr:putative sulfate exporter family transporter [Rhodopila sp.]
MTKAPPRRFIPGLALEDWWAVVIGLFLVAVGCLVFRVGFGLNDIAATPQPWTSLAELYDQLAGDVSRYLAVACTLLSLFTAAAFGLGLPPFRFALVFIILLALAFATLLIAAWVPVWQVGMEPPVIALCLGAVLGNLIALPSWIKEGLRAELYIKTGVVLLGATVPLPLLRLAGPVTIFQASAIALVTFITIYGVARFLGVNRQLSAMLAGGGSVCGVSATIAIAGAVRARREDISIATTMVVAWSLGMIVLLPLLARAWYLPAGPAGAWIGSSEFADAAGFAAVQVYSGLLRGATLMGSADQALWAFTLVKVIGRDMWIGMWAAAISVYAMLRWQTADGTRLEPSQIWHRFPKFIIGFVIASTLIAWTNQGTSVADYNSIAGPRLIGPLAALRELMFNLSFLSIGASMRLRKLMPVGGNAFIAFAAGVVVNLVLGFILSAVIFQDHWNSLTR